MTEPGVYRTRLFPRRPDIRWACPVHEVIWPAIRRAGLATRPARAAVHHTGYSDPVIRARKRARNERILRAWLAESPGNPFALWHAGRLAADQGDWAAALRFYRRGLAGWPAELMADAPWAYIAQAEWELGHCRAALRTCSESLALAPDHAPAWFAKGRMHLGLGEVAEAERCWRHVLTLASGSPESIADYDRRFEACRARRELASLAIVRGDHEAAARLHRQILAEAPDDLAARARLRVLDSGRVESLMGQDSIEVAMPSESEGRGGR